MLESANASSTRSPPHAPRFELALRAGGRVAVRFTAMGSACELLLDAADGQQALELARAAALEAWRVESKFSRYRPQSIVSAINNSRGHAVVVDAETAELLAHAAQWHELSAGRFDITSGVLRRCWKFDGSDHVPDPAAVAELLPLIGFAKIRWQAPRITLPPGMEIDFGGFGKEYAVDRILGVVSARFGGAALIDFNGDLAANGAPAEGPWQVGIERPGGATQPRLLLELSQGGVATVNDTRHFLFRDGVRYGDILDVRSGWPVAHMPHSVTVGADSCLEAGRLATFAMLQGSAAETFLGQQGEPHWCLR